jgi:DNA invertase Pin-like site-specific DNA recombinase
MHVIGYARVSATDQNLELQERALRAAGCEIIRSEKRSGTTTAGRDQLQNVLDFLREDDVLMVTRIDRLARSVGDLQDIVRAVKARGASLKATEQPLDTSTAAGKCFLDMLACSRRSRPICAASASLRGSPMPKRAASTRGGRRASILRRSYK